MQVSSDIFAVCSHSRLPSRLTSYLYIEALILIDMVIDYKKEMLCDYEKFLLKITEAFSGNVFPFAT